jgi:hypothetical protein
MGRGHDSKTEKLTTRHLRYEPVSHVLCGPASWFLDRLT